MNTLQVFWDAIKESSLANYTSLARFKSTLQTWLNNIVSYGSAGPDDLRSWALQFTLSRREFAEAINAYFRSEAERLGYRTNNRWQVEICPRCNHLEWMAGMGHVVNGHITPDHPREDVRVCSKCYSNYYTACQHCGLTRERTVDGAQFFVSVAHHYSICMDCVTANPGTYVQCVACHRWHAPRNLEIHRYDRNSRGRYIHNDLSGEFWVCSRCQPPEASRCQPRHPEFTFPALNLGPDRTVAQDEMFEVAHGGGDISATGLTEIYNLIQTRTKGHVDGGGVRVMELIRPQYNFDSRWQTTEGNFPKRIAKLLVSLHHLKLTEELMSEIGNIAQRYTSKPGTYRLSITRDVNGPRQEYVNGDSCWWSSYWWSRCNFKSLGGFGLRTWDGEIPTGRAWMIPMKANAPGSTAARAFDILQTAPEQLPADAYIVFNGYGPNNSRLDSMEFARMVASMTGKSYRKINFGVHHHYMYVNGTNVGADAVGKGVLVAPQEICDQVTEYTLRTIPNRCSCPGKPA